MREGKSVNCPSLFDKQMNKNREGDKKPENWPDEKCDTLESQLKGHISQHLKECNEKKKDYQQS